MKEEQKKILYKELRELLDKWYEDHHFKPLPSFREPLEDFIYQYGQDSYWRGIDAMKDQPMTTKEELKKEAREYAKTNPSHEEWIMFIDKLIPKATTLERERITLLLPKKKKKGSDGQKHNGWNNAIKAMNKAIKHRHE